MKKFVIRRVFMILIFASLGLAAFSAIVMALWNAILPAVLHVAPIDFWQALGILVLSKILFGGFMFRKGRGWEKGGRRSWPQAMRERWNTMTPEEKEKFRQRWKDRCGWNMDERAQTGGSEPAHEA